MTEERYLLADEVAERLRVSPAAVREWLRTGRLTGLVVGRQWRITEQDLAEYLERAREKGQRKATE